MKMFSPRFSLAVVSLLTLFASSTYGAHAQKKFVGEKEVTKKTMGGQAVRTPSGLVYRDMKVGNGASPSPGATVTVHYTGWLHPSNQKFDSSVDKGQPFSFTIGYGQVIKGWDEGVMSMRVGGRRVLLIPPNLGYGPNGMPGAIPPNSTLKFDVQLIAVKAGRG
ncbi:FKBP-type peptidyl-prolyl cis-trans isomerase [bacterium]|nr:FKBP-type peptidyl-prolyl cis-trans isomerase [bacterium]QQR57010.1 MAG: FKBP-type peptidyl-prolyl cis-trans isomerase [Candidatus Melainabacteria bacterium]